MGAPGQDIFMGDVSCQTHFFREGEERTGGGGGGGGEGGLAKLHFGGGPFWWGPCACAQSALP